MTDPVMIYSSLMRVQIDRLNAISENASNVNTTGYLSQTNQIDANSFINLINGQEGAGSSNLSSKRSTQLGQIKVTNLATDMALASDHWFLIAVDGKAGVTRNGHFSLSKDGALMLGGFPVIGSSGPIENISKLPQIRADGSIYVDGKLVDQLKIVELSSASNLSPLGNGIYEADGEINEAQGAKVIQGALNSSNVSLESDMTKLIEITRHVESMQRAISTYDHMLDVGINQIGK